MKKPKEPVKPRKPPEPSKMLPPRKEIQSIHSGITLGAVLKMVEGVDPDKVEINASYGYYDSIDLDLEWTNDNPGKNPHYEKQLKRYENALVDYEQKLQEYQTLKAAYDRDLKAYLVQFHKDQLAKLERKMGKAK